MTALTTDRHTNERTNNTYAFPIQANTLCYGGGLATLTATGYVRPGTVDGSSPTCVPVGRFRRRYNNLTGADPMMDMTTAAVAQVEIGVYRWENSAADPVTVASLHKVCYVLDDCTVAATSATNTRGPAGIVMDIDSMGIWVATGVPLVMA